MQARTVDLGYACLGEVSPFLGGHCGLDLTNCSSILFVLPHHLYHKMSHGMLRVEESDLYHVAAPAFLQAAGQSAAQTMSTCRFTQAAAYLVDKLPIDASD